MGEESQGVEEKIVSPLQKEKVVSIPLQAFDINARLFKEANPIRTEDMGDAEQGILDLAIDKFRQRRLKDKYAMIDHAERFLREQPCEDEFASRGLDIVIGFAEKRVDDMKQNPDNAVGALNDLKVLYEVSDKLSDKLGLHREQRSSSK